MPHARSRHVLKNLINRLKFSPVVTIQGVRQAGKSFLARELLKKVLPEARYVTLDQPSRLDFALTNPESFLAEQETAKPLIIDEAQKCPVLFDTIKFLVDQNRRPGRFLLLGSTEFSKLTRIRESLTGRMSRVRLYPLNFAETLGLSPNDAMADHLFKSKARVTRAQLMKHLATGGMPALFSIRNNTERMNAMQDWLDLTTQRDALQFKGVVIDGTLCAKILEKIARLEEPSAGAIAKSLKVDLRRIKTHLEVLKTLFVVLDLPPHPAGTGKTLYFICDVGLAGLLGANFERQLYTFILGEFSSQMGYRDQRDIRLSFYRTAKGRFIHFILESAKKTQAIKLVSEERIDKRDLEILKAFREKNPELKADLIALGSAHFVDKKNKIEIFPWEGIV